MKNKFTGRDYWIKMKMKDNEIVERKVFTKNKKEAIKYVKDIYNGKNGLRQIIKIKPSTKWYREM